MCKFSIIIPVYNVEKYICQCLNSIFNQDYKDFEVIIIDDGSTDSSGQLCERYLKQVYRNNYNLIHTENSGVSTARNTGLRMAKGKYICFIDADDYVDNNFLSVYNRYLENEDIDILYGGIRWISSKKESLPYFDTHGKKCKGMDVIDMFPETYKNKALPFSWRYCFRREFLIKNNLSFPVNVKFGEDTIFNINAIINSNSFMSINQVVYNYRTDNSNSMVKKEAYKNNLLHDLEMNYQSRKKILPLLTKNRKMYCLDMMKKNLYEWLPTIIENYKQTPEGFTLKKAYLMLSVNMFKESADFIIRNKLSNSKSQRIYYLLISKRLYLPLYYIWKNRDLTRYII